jgi:hypothetical protein
MRSRDYAAPIATMSFGQVRERLRKHAINELPSCRTLQLRGADTYLSHATGTCGSDNPCDYRSAVRHILGTARNSPRNRSRDMAEMDVALKDALQVDGAIAAALVDQTSGMALGTAGGDSTFDVTVAAAANTEVLRAKLRAIDLLGLRETIDDILVTLETQYHLLRPITSRSGRGLFLYLALHRDRANLALARHRLRVIEQSVEI